MTAPFQLPGEAQQTSAHLADEAAQAAAADAEFGHNLDGSASSNDANNAVAKEVHTALAFGGLALAITVLKAEFCAQITDVSDIVVPLEGNNSICYKDAGLNAYFKLKNALRHATLPSSIGPCLLPGSSPLGESYPNCTPNCRHGQGHRPQGQSAAGQGAA